MSVLLLATFDTKADEAAYLTDRLVAGGVPVQHCDISLNAKGHHWSAEEKLDGMAKAAPWLAKGEGDRFQSDVALDVQGASPKAPPLKPAPAVKQAAKPEPGSAFDALKGLFRK